MLFGQFSTFLHFLGHPRLSTFQAVPKEPVAKEPVYWNDFTLWDTARNSRN